MGWNGTGSSWQYSRWIYSIGRNMRITEPTGAELTAVKTFLKYIWDPGASTGTRPWLAPNYDKKSVSSLDQYDGDPDVESTTAIVELLQMVGRDLKKLPITNAEKTQADTLISATGNRRYGTGVYFGGVGGATVTIP
jgi:hypothetical protein